MILQLLIQNNYSIFYFMALPVLFSSAALAAAPIHVGTTRQGDFSVVVTLIKDRDNAAHAVKIELVNKSQKNIAFIKSFDRPKADFSLKVHERDISGKLITYVFPPPVVDSDPDLKFKTLEIQPNKSAIFCLKLHEYLLPNVALNRAIDYEWFVSVGGDVDWKAAEKSATTKKKIQPKSWIDDYIPPIFLGQHKTSIQKTKGCDAAP